MSDLSKFLSSVKFDQSVAGGLDIGPILNELIKQLPEALKPSVSLYAPVLRRLTEDNFWAVVNNLNNDKLDEVQILLRQNMTAEELVNEKKNLNNLLQALASDNYKTRQFAMGILSTALNIGLHVVSGRFLGV
jgi:hypothetical protein